MKIFNFQQGLGGLEISTIPDLAVVKNLKDANTLLWRQGRELPISLSGSEERGAENTIDGEGGRHKKQVEPSKGGVRVSRDSVAAGRSGVQLI